jgi:DNA-binding response OmpR family regulator
MKQSRHASLQSKILLVDDERDILDILARVLVSAGYDVDTACNGQVALEKIALQDYDLIITNVRMPVMSGDVFYRQLCVSHPCLSKRVIFCTGDIANLATQRFLNSTGAPVIFKPFQLSTVLEVVSWKLTKARVPAQLPALPLTQPDTLIAPAF